MKYKPSRKYYSSSKKGVVANAQNEVYEDESGITAKRMIRDSITKPPVTQRDADIYNSSQKSDYGIEKDIIKSDVYRKAGDFPKATDKLYEVTLRLKSREKSEKDHENYKSSIKYESWIENRAKRLIKQATRAKDKESARIAYSILQKLDKDPHPHSENLEDKVLHKRKAIPPWMGLIGIILGLFFLSPNITGNTIGNMTQESSNLIGIVLFMMGLIGAWFLRRD